jgi:hypothetical protein
VLDNLTITDFSTHLDQTFYIRLEGVEPIDLKLVSVAKAGTTSQPEARQAFSLHFLGPSSSQYLLQHIYRLEHEQMGVLELFIVPLGLEDGRMRYEAIFT